MINKWYLLGIIILVIIVIIGTLVAVDFQGWGKALAGAGGPFAAGLYNALVTPFKWAASGGWPTLGAALAIIGILMIASAWSVWHYDIPYKFTGAASSSSSQTMANTTKREPDEPELAPTIKG